MKYCKYGLLTAEIHTLFLSLTISTTFLGKFRLIPLTVFEILLVYIFHNLDVNISSFDLVQHPLEFLESFNSMLIAVANSYSHK